ncbi:MAG: tRNA (adenosine(37)-N6)-dimethylallyltransferase MiaA [Pedosphaera sp.]|nr:tRNA (adenosine(37)-N6)-dimethylallyltransferase MiaA [Pedosphaera sp.]
MPAKDTALRSLFLVGPTAAGKSAVALHLAHQIGGEIISVDSMQVYRGLDLGTAKPSAEERAQIPHHLVDVVELTESFSAGDFVRFARVAEGEIRARGNVPIFCGGTGLYLRAYFEGLGEAPPSDALLRATLEATPLEALLRELEQADPATFAKIDRQNPRRLVRALEVIRLTGKPFAEQRAAWDLRAAPRLLCLQRDPVDLRARIQARVDEMFRRGLVDETRRLLEYGLDRNRTAMQAIGYRQVVEHLRGERSLIETVALVKTKTWQFARRQRTWFRQQMNAHWMEVSASETAAQIVTRVLAVAKESSGGVQP